MLRLPVDGYRSRITDYLNAAERGFLALTDVEVASLDGTPRVERRAFIALSLRHIVLAMPADEDALAAEAAAAGSRRIGRGRELNSGPWQPSGQTNWKD